MNRKGLIKLEIVEERMNMKNFLTMEKSEKFQNSSE
jgi:hypothetical protein